MVQADGPVKLGSATMLSAWTGKTTRSATRAKKLRITAFFTILEPPFRALLRDLKQARFHSHAHCNQLDDGTVSDRLRKNLQLRSDTEVLVSAHAQYQCMTEREPHSCVARTRLTQTPTSASGGLLPAYP